MHAVPTPQRIALATAVLLAAGCTTEPAATPTASTRTPSAKIKSGWPEGGADAQLPESAVGGANRAARSSPTANREPAPEKRPLAAAEKAANGGSKPANNRAKPEADRAEPTIPVARVDLGASVTIGGIPHIRQRPDFCGEACAAMFLQKLGHKHTQDDVFDVAGLDPLKARGCFTPELVRALRRIGFRLGDVWRYCRPNDPDSIGAEFEKLRNDLRRGFPSIVCMRYDEQPETTEHFRLIVGFDAAKGEVVYHEPAEDQGAYRRMPLKKFLALWPLKYETRRWLLVRMRLEPGRIVAPAKKRGFRDAAYAQHVMRLRKRLPSEDFHLVLERPFVVIGDSSADEVRRYARGTIRWAVRKLKAKYFHRDPFEILDIWLFKDKESYEKHTEAIFKEKPDTPYGFYSRTHRALIMNIATGGGTLVHEIVHPFMESNFPRCPSWFNEGLASLYEQSSERRGQIVGLTNWRLRGLQLAIEDDSLPTFEALCGTTTDEFYDDGAGLRYAQARYLCYYLQQKGRLPDFYHTFRKQARDDPGGYKTLQKILGETDMADFQKRWQKYVSQLKFP